ncbi:uncharacterized protein N0V89_009923 [Didymosphaeria variabile]|uniref:Sugar phosphate transporter domain-containing protein n=1 Tax=Didymosphaeria variabile TaxID=1932322 RepID=A0A9W8XG12_9PLEO|nr:uncharacterized protein N0V89_009923 [Didymosphaeria variabile]KAJ4348546.1 hypothetical protein N0V89_009923 [Didymosphaeria variabile]
MERNDNEQHPAVLDDEKDDIEPNKPLLRDEEKMADTEGQVPHRKQEQDANRTRILAYLGVYFLINLSLTFYNKLVLGSFAFPWILTAIHTGTSALGCSILLLLGHFQLSRLTLREHFVLVTFSLLFTLNIAMSNVSLEMVSIPFHQVMRATTPVFCILIYRVLYARTYATAIYASIVPVIVGVGLATFGDYHFTALGFTLTLSGVVLAAVKTVVTNRLMTGRLKLPAYEVLLRMGPLAALQSLLYSVLTGEFSEFLAYVGQGQLDGGRLMAVAGNGILAFVLNVASFQTNKLAGALSMTICANLKQCLTIVLGAAFWNIRMNAVNGAGILLALGGAACSEKTFDVDIDVASDINQKTANTRGFHLLTTATGNDLNVCRLVLSAAVLSYPPNKTHLAKVRAPLRYFDTLPASSDDDLVLIIDGYDVIFQLGPDVLLQRYHEVVKASNARLEEQFGADHVKKINMYNTILFGPDVLCYPIDFRRPACWIVPESTLPRDAFGSETDKDDEHTRPRWLNSGTVLGPVKDLRRLFLATMDKVDKTWDPEFYGRNSDQMYLADVWADQEFVRMTSTGKNATFPLPDAVPDDVKPNIFTPEPEDRRKAEQHVGIDYESRMFQTVALFYDILQWATFDRPRTFVTKDEIHQFSLKLPKDVEQSKAPYRALNKWGWGNAWLKRKTWKDVSLGINTVTKKHLLKAEPDRGVITTIEGINWVPYLPYGKQSAREDAWADQGELLKWDGLCGEHEHALYKGWRQPPPEPEPEPEQEVKQEENVEEKEEQ